MPASSAVAPDIASDIIAGKLSPAPMPKSSIVGRMSDDVVPVHGHAREQQQAGEHDMRPASSVLRAPKRSISLSVTRSENTRDQHRDRQEREADLDRAVAQDPLQVEGAEEEHPEQPGHHQHLDQVRAGDVARAQDAQRHQRRGRARLARRRTRRSGRSRRRRGRACAASPSRSPRPRRSCRRASIRPPVTSTAPGTSAPLSSPMPSSFVDQAAGEHHRGEAERQVHEEDPVPVDRLGEHAAGEQAERRARGGDEAVHADRLRLLALARGTSSRSCPGSPRR